MEIPEPASGLVDADHLARDPEHLGRNERVIHPCHCGAVPDPHIHRHGCIIGIDDFVRALDRS